MLDEYWQCKHDTTKPNFTTLKLKYISYYLPAVPFDNARLACGNNNKLSS